MTRPDRRLPSLKALSVFDAVMRCNGMRAASEELFITPQAVSQQMKSLEDQLQVRLFRRQGRSIVPTEEATILARYIDNGLQAFAEGVKAVTNAQRVDRINVNASPYFAANFLIPRLNEFLAIRPRCDIRLKTDVEVPEFNKEDIDVAIQWGFGGWDEYEVKFLFHDIKILCCAPALARGIRQPDDVARHTLLRPVRSNTLWRDVLVALGARNLEPKTTIGFYDNESMRRAAVEGLGVGLISERDARREIQLGTLVAPFGEDVFDTMPPDRIPAFYLIYPKSRDRLPSVSEFCKWVANNDWKPAPSPA